LTTPFWGIKMIFARKNSVSLRLTFLRCYIKIYRTIIKWWTDALTHKPRFQKRKKSKWSKKALSSSTKTIIVMQHKKLTSMPTGNLTQWGGIALPIFRIVKVYRGFTYMYKYSTGICINLQCVNINEHNLDIRIKI